MNNTSIIILAAGLGTRMKSKRPKVLFELCGEPMIIHILKQAYAITNDVSVVLHYEKELISKKIKEIFPQTKIFEQDLANFPGTAGAIKGVSLSGEKVLVTCGDMPLVRSTDLMRLANAEADVVMSSFEAANPFGYGRVIIKNGKVEAIVEQKDASEAQLAIKSVNAGCYCFKREALEQILPLISNQNAQKEYYLTDAIKIANEKGLKCVAVNVNEQNFMGINDKFQLSIAEKIMQDEIKQNLMKAGVLMRMPESIFIDSRAKFEILNAVADELLAQKEAIKATNAKDLANGEKSGLSLALLDRLRLTDARIEAMAKGVREVAGFAEVVGENLGGWTHPNGMQISRIRVPLGVLGIISPFLIFCGGKQNWKAVVKARSV